MKNLYFALTFSLFMTYITALANHIPGSHNPANERRTANTCGDPTVSTTYFEGFNPSVKAHSLDLLSNYVHADTVGGANWQIVAPAFRAWTDAGQPSTVPFYFLFNPTTTDYAYLISSTSTPPTRSGFDAAVLIGYVYPTQICNSVPLYSVFQPDDHYYTTNLAEHDDFVNRLDWSDGGIVGYVLPIDNVSETVA